MFLGCSWDVCQMFAKCLRLSWCLLGQLSMIQELPAVARWRGCIDVCFSRCETQMVKPRGAKSFFEMNGERDRRRSFWKRSTLLSLHLRVLNSPKRLSPSKNHGAPEVYWNCPKFTPNRKILTPIFQHHFPKINLFFPGLQS